eukprot:756585-Hanusia_phi.AAC.3
MAHVLRRMFTARYCVSYGRNGRVAFPMLSLAGGACAFLLAPVSPCRAPPLSLPLPSFRRHDASHCHTNSFCCAMTGKPAELKDGSQTRKGASPKPLSEEEKKLAESFISPQLLRRFTQSDGTVVRACPGRFQHDHARQDFKALSKTIP